MAPFLVSVLLENSYVKLSLSTIHFLTLNLLCTGGGGWI
jgi:hypothetical protein